MVVLASQDIWQHNENTRQILFCAPWRQWPEHYTEQIEGLFKLFERHGNTTYIGPFFIGATLQNLVGSKHISLVVQAHREDGVEILFGTCCLEILRGCRAHCWQAHWRELVDNPTDSDTLLVHDLESIPQEYVHWTDNSLWGISLERALEELYVEPPETCTATLPFIKKQWYEQVRNDNFQLFCTINDS